MSEEGLRAAEEKMRAAGVPERAITVFGHYYRLVEKGDTGMLAESDIEPLGEVPRVADVTGPDDTARRALAHTVVVKLNGGLGTSMGMDRAKSLVSVRDGRSFLDLIAEQILALRQRYDVQLPLVLMDSFRTRDDTLAALRRHDRLPVKGLPLDFLQSREPKLLAADLTPVEWPAEPSLEWCPPGHGDVYISLESSGLLEALLAAGYRHLFLSNADNLGAVPDPRIAGWFADSGAPFLAEVCRRTEADRKGGHLAVRREDGRLVLRETAQTRSEDAAALADTTRHRYFNTNNLWVDLEALRDRLVETDGVLGLPMIRNLKTVDPTDAESPEVIQVETAMGAAVEVFAGARAVEVDRGRFLPVKTTNDLLVLRSDVYEVTDEHRVVMASRRQADAPVVDLDPAYYKFLADFERRYPAGPPSLVNCERLTVRGDVTFGADVVVRGAVTIERDEAYAVPDATVLSGPDAD